VSEDELVAPDAAPQSPGQAPPSPDYVLGPKHPPSPGYDQPLLDDASSTSLSPGYITDFDPKKDPEEDPEEDPADYPTDGGDDADDESSDDDEEFEVGESSLASAARQAQRPMSRKDTHDDRALQRGRVIMLFRDRRFNHHTAMLLESEARHAREAWSHSMNCSKAVHLELQAYQIQTRDTRIGSLETLVVTLVAQASSLQTQLTTALERILTLEARKPAHTDNLEDKMQPKKRTATTITTTPMADAQIKALIAQGIVDVLEKIKANRTSRNGDDNHDSGTGSRRTERVAREC
nr:hypothetical protein [Tanacetum cinerariifolium]